jgi:hypothetical protein
MSILVAIRREQKKVRKQLARLQNQLNGLETAALALGNSTKGQLNGVKKRVLSVAGRAKIAAAARKRWAKVRAQAKKMAS